MLHQHEGSGFFFGKPQAGQFGFLGILWVLKLIAPGITVINDGGVHAAAQILQVTLKGGVGDLEFI